MLIHAFISSRLDYYNQLVVGDTGQLVNKLQQLLKAAANLITETPPKKRPRQTISFKAGILIFKCLNKLAAEYLSENTAN